MKPEEINRRIASLCGWQEYRSEHRDEMRWRGPDGHNWLVTPDYWNDLNACREFERRLDGDYRSLYIDMIYLLVSKSIDNFEQQWAVFNATPAHRCEAFLRMHKQWDV